MDRSNISRRHLLFASAGLVTTVALSSGGSGPDVSYEAHPLDSGVPAGGWSRRIRTSAGTVFVGEVRTTDHRREQDRRQWQSCDGVRREGARGWSYAPALDQFRGCGRAARVPRHEGASGQGPRSDLDGDGEVTSQSSPSPTCPPRPGLIFSRLPSANPGRSSMLHPASGPLTTSPANSCRFETASRRRPYITGDPDRS